MPRAVLCVSPWQEEDDDAECEEAESQRWRELGLIAGVPEPKVVSDFMMRNFSLSIHTQLHGLC